MKIDARKKVIASLVFSVLFIGLIIVLSFTIGEKGLETDHTMKNHSPSLLALFGTDSLGRDMLTRTVKGLKFSLFVGIVGSTLGVLIALFLGILAAVGGVYVDRVVMWFVDMFIGMPHLVFMILVSFAVGRGAMGVIVATAVTHWPALARVVRNEVMAIKKAEYILISKNTGKSRWFIVRKHILPAIFPQIFIGFVLLFPHVILHEASMTFLGFGLSAQQPSIGIILSEATKHISLGNWWPVVFPGLALIILVKCFDNIGSSLRILNNPQTRYL